MVNISDNVIDRITQRIVHEVHPQRILLFGSWARGEVNKDSDIDLLVVEREPFGPARGSTMEGFGPSRYWYGVERRKGPI